VDTSEIPTPIAAVSDYYQDWPHDIPPVLVATASPPRNARRSGEALSGRTGSFLLRPHIKTVKDPNDSFYSTVLLLRDIGETHEWEITITDQAEKPMSRFTFRGSRREADDMAIKARLSFEVKLEAIARNVKVRPATEPARQG
jgi:hypothetical protein